jgi:hypothetical protein
MTNTDHDTDLPYITAGDLRPAGDPSPAIDDFKNYAGDEWFGFCHTFSKSIPRTGENYYNNLPARTYLE